MNSKTIQYAQEIDEYFNQCLPHQIIKHLSDPPKISSHLSMTELGGMEEIKSIQEVSAIGKRPPGSSQHSPD